ncbi:hypothetical protein ARAM_005263 [Aspergillus rambellii]|uniref:BTB domain-containing protein n=1 Tax=Aspergillus rambellii TaxID=308745 RepID=A0A0F8WLI1_9EURO|nr:hypothetical protein ARAM_005263 [Aspergillus rambellii]
MMIASQLLTELRHYISQGPRPSPSPSPSRSRSRSPSQPQPQPRPITLQVGERQFTTTHETLTAESDFFACLLSARWAGGSGGSGGSPYFIDADPALFEHILRYLRRGVLPVFYDMARGHDHARYLALLEEARYFQIARLQTWLENRQYVHALRVECGLRVVPDACAAASTASTTLPSDTAVEYHAAWGAKHVYVCPRGIAVHRGDPGACGRRCMNALGDSEAVYDEEPTVRLLEVEKRVVFDMRACRAGR